MRGVDGRPPRRGQFPLEVVRSCSDGILKTMETLRHRPAVLLVVRLEENPRAVFPPELERRSDAVSAGWRPLARAAHPGVVGLAATLATGVWPERHGQFRSTHPHADRLSMVRTTLEPTQLPVLWHDVVSAGGRAAVVGWPHATLAPPATSSDDLVWIDDHATAPRREGQEGSLPIRTGTVFPRRRRAAILARRRAFDGDLVPDLLQSVADEGPDLLVGWLDGADQARADDMMNTITDRLRARRRAGVVVLELRHARPAASILSGPRFEPAPLLRIRSHDGAGEVPWTGRPRIDAIASVVRTVLDVAPVPPPHDAEPTPGLVADERRRTERSRRITGLVEEFVMDQQREIGLSLYARGLRQEARSWIRAACEDRHGRVDSRLAVLLLMLAASGAERTRLLESLRPRLPHRVTEAWDKWAAEASPVAAGDLSELGPFIAGAFDLLAQRARAGDRRKIAGEPRD